MISEKISVPVGWALPSLHIFQKSNISPIYNKICQLQSHQQVFWVGIGCQRGTSRQLMETAIQQVFRENHLDENAIAGIATIDTKASEVGLREFCHLRNLPLKTFPAEILRTVWVPNPAKLIDQEVGTPSVAEAAAIFAAGGEKLEKQQSLNSSLTNLTVRLLVPKQIFRLQGEGSVTVAVAQEMKG
ncbi:MAG: cobalamin biosynthesis protein [Gloeotrichia echinulata DEX184]